MELPPPPDVPPLVPRRLDLGEGVAVCVRVPPHDALPPIEAWPIEPAERAQAASWGTRRQNTWIAGRLALREAARALGVECGAILPNDRRAPSLPVSVSGSLTHTTDWAVAWLAPADGRTRGIDLEDPARGGMHLAPMLLTDAERIELDALPAGEQQAALIRRFALKEAVYKAIDPRYRRYVDFKEVETRPAKDGAAAVRWMLSEGEAPPRAMALRWRRWGDAGWLCTAVAAW